MKKIKDMSEGFTSSYSWPKEERILLLSTYLQVLGNIKNKKVLDLGCGTGWITKIISKDAKSVLGIDISERMIDFAKINNKSSNLNYKLLDLVKLNEVEKFDIITSSLTLHLITPHSILVNLLKKCNNYLEDDGSVVILVPHPCFIDRNNRPYSKFILSSNFNYFKQEQKYKVNLKTEKSNLEFFSNFYNLQGFFDAFKKAGFVVSELFESSVPDFAIEKYANLWTQELKFPFHILFKLKKVKK